MSRLPFLTVCTLLVAAFFFSSCSDKAVAPVENKIIYRDLNNRAVGYENPFGLDINNDGDSELYFTTGLFYIDGAVRLEFIFIPRHANQSYGSVHHVSLLNKGDQIAPGNPFEKQTYTLMAQVNRDNEITWTGHWKDAQNKFIGFRVRETNPINSYFYGWIRVSADTTSNRLILHDAAWNTIPESEIRAGYDH